MTPVLIGRWQTRLLLFGPVGLLVTLIFGWFYGVTPLVVLLYVFGIGLGWDILYDKVQIKLRWDQDWPPLFQLISGIVEGIVIWLLILFGLAPNVSFGIFVAHYSAVWLAVFLSTQGPLRILFPRWRYHGGRWM